MPLKSSPAYWNSWTASAGLAGRLPLDRLDGLLRNWWTDSPEYAGGRTAIEVAPEILDLYVGEYELTPKISIVVTVEDGALFAQGTGEPGVPLFAESETEFFARVVDAQVTFQLDEDGEVTGLILHQGGRDVLGRKVR